MKKINELTVVVNTEKILAVSNSQVIIYNKNIYSYNIATKELLWEHKADNGEYNLSSCQLHGNLLYASFNHYRSGYADMHDYRLIIIDTQNGSIVWKASVVSDNNYFCVNNNLVFSLNASENKISCFDTSKSDNNLLWEQKIKIKVDNSFKGEYMVEVSRKYKPRILSCFIWNDFLVVTSDANQWLYINTATGTVERTVELTHKLIGKQQMYPFYDRPLVVNNNTATFIYRGVLCRVNLDNGETNAYATSYDGKEQNKMTSKNNLWGNYDRHVFLADNNLYFSNDSTLPEGLFEIPVNSTDGVITRKVEFTTRLDYLNTPRAKVCGNCLYINKSCISKGLIRYNLETGETTQIEGKFEDFTMVNNLLFMVTNNSVLVYAQESGNEVKN